MSDPKKKLTVAIIGLGSQAKAWAANLSDNGHSVTIFLRKDSTSLESVKRAGYHHKELSLMKNWQDNKGAKEDYDFYLLLTPDETHDELLSTYFNWSKQTNTAPKIVLAHGYSHWKSNFETKYPYLHFYLLAPKAIASELRSNFLQKKPIFAATKSPTSVHNDIKAFEILVADLGVTRAISADFKEEAVADLFSEQTLLCGLLPYSAKASFNTLVEAGINPELAYIECWHEVKLIADAMIEYGPAGLFDLISPNALIGAEEFRKKKVDKGWNDTLLSTLNSIKKGDFIQIESQTQTNVLKAEVLKEWEESKIQTVYNSLARVSNKSSKPKEKRNS